MSKELNDFKQMRITALNKQYTIDLNSLNIINARNVNIVNRSRLSSKQKRESLARLQIQYNNILTSLRNKLKSDKESVNKISILPIKISRKKALIFGLNYIGTSSQLNGCINDAKLIENRIKTSGFTDIKIVTDETSIKPSRENILKEIKNILSEATEGDLIFIYYSGHGSYTIDRSKDELDGKDELIIPLDFNAISDDELKVIIQENLKEKTTLFCLFDCCHSGSILDLRYQYMDSLDKNNFTENINETETNGNVIMISGCSDIQTSSDANINNKNQGAMTWAFLEAFKSEKNITWRNLLIKMRELLKNSKFDQIPQLTTGSFLNIDSPVFI